MNLDLLGAECNPCSLVLRDKFPCSEPAKTEDWKRTEMLNDGGKRKEHQWMDQRLTKNLPVGIRKGKYEKKLSQKFDLMFCFSTQNMDVMLVIDITLVL